MHSCVKSSRCVLLVLSFLLLGANDLRGQERSDPFDAIRNNHTADLTGYLSRGGSPNAADHLGSLLDYAVIANKLNLVTILLEHGADPNSNKNSEGAPLFVTAKKGYLDIAETLIAHGANVNADSGNGLPLVAAMGTKHIAVAQLLLSKGAKMPSGRFTLMWAVRSGSAEMTRIAIAANSPNAFELNLISEQDKNNRIPPNDTEDEMKQSWEDEPLVEQAEEPEVLEALLDAHFDPNIEDGVTFKRCVLGSFCNPEIVRVLITHGVDPNLSIKLEDGTTTVPIVAAAENANAGVVRVLLLAHADPNSADSSGATALLKGSAGHQLDLDDIVRTLIEANADPNRTDKNGSSALENAVRRHNLGLANFLLEHNADPNISSGAPLLAAVREGYLDITKTLISHGARVNPINGSASPLSEAAMHREIVEFLVSQGAITPPGREGLLWAIGINSPQLTRQALAGISKEEISSLSIGEPTSKSSSANDTRTLANEPLVARIENPDVLAVLLDAGFDPNAGHGQALSNACLHDHLDIVGVLLRHGANPDQGVDDHGDPDFPLLQAVTHGNAEIVKVLLMAHADAHVANPQSDSALMKSARQGNPKVVHYLLDAGVDPNESDSNGDTPLIVASRYGYVDNVGYLVAAGANTNAKNKAGVTALLEAATVGSPTVVSILLAKGADRTTTLNGKSAKDLARANGNANALTVLEKGPVPEPQSLPRSWKLEGSQEPREVLDALLYSPTFRDRFFLSVPNETGKPLDLLDYRKDQLKVEVDFLLAFVKSLIKKQASETEKRLGVHLLPTDSTQVTLNNGGTAQAYALQNHDDPSGSIIVDLKLLQAAYWASMRENFWRQDPENDVPSAFRRIQHLSYLSHVRIDRKEFGWDSLISTDPTDKRSPRQLSRDMGQLGGFVPTVLPAGVQYTGILLFVIAHELGHIALGHGLKDIPCLDRELAADAFAASVLGESLVAMSIQEDALVFFNAPLKEASNIGYYLAVDRQELRRYTGFSLFFDKSYEVVNFGPLPSSCTYPEPGQRLEVGTKTVEAIASLNEDAVIAGLVARPDLNSFLNGDLRFRNAVISDVSGKTIFSGLHFWPTSQDHCDPKDSLCSGVVLTRPMIC